MANHSDAFQDKCVPRLKNHTVKLSNVAASPNPQREGGQRLFCPIFNKFKPLTGKP
jgi:hypothetical protein